MVNPMINHQHDHEYITSRKQLLNHPGMEQVEARVEMAGHGGHGTKGEHEGGRLRSQSHQDGDGPGDAGDGSDGSDQKLLSTQPTIHPLYLQQCGFIDSSDLFHKLY